MTTEARGRLQRVLAAERLPGDLDPVLLPSHSNDTWRLGQLVVRMCWRGDIGRLVKEATLAASLPESVRYPDPVSAGGDEEMSWLVTRWVDGQPLNQVWSSLDLRQQRRAVTEMAGILSALHTWRPPPPVVRLLDHGGSSSADPDSIVGIDLVPLPVHHVFLLAEHARHLAHVDSQQIGATEARLHSLAEFDPYTTGEQLIVINSDLHFANLLWRDDEIVAALDFEWARLGSPDQDLEPFLRSVDWSGTDPEMLPPNEMARILGWLATDYPALFTHPNLVDRLWLYQLTYTLRELYTWPIPATAKHLAADHPLNHLPRFTAGTAHLHEVLRDLPATTRPSGNRTG